MLFCCGMLAISIFSGGCIDCEDTIKQVPKGVVSSESNLQTEKDIKTFIVSNMIDSIIMDGAITIRLINEPCFGEIKKQLATNKILFEHGGRNIPINSGGNPPWEEDGLNYFPEYIYKHKVTCIQIEKFSIPQNSGELKVNVGMFRSGMDAAGYTFIFRKKGKFWVYYTREMNWIS